MSAARGIGAPVRSRGPAVASRTLKERSHRGRRAWTLPELDVPPAEVPPEHRRDTAPGLPEVSEVDVVRHFTRLSQINYGVDTGFYPLGSCSMKYNPKVAEAVAAMPGFQRIHPHQPEHTIQGGLELLWRLEQALCEITGMARVTFQPPAGASGELTGLLVMRAFHTKNGNPRTKVVIPDSAHGTNPASVTLSGYHAVQVPSDARGLVDLSALEKLVDEDVAGLMLTNPNTLGLFEEEIEGIAAAMHRVGALLYYDGANLNAIMGRARPGDMGFDIVHMNTHKTFATPHGGGGPGAGPVAVTPRLERFLPAPVVGFDEVDGRYFWDHDRPDSIGPVHGFHGNFGVLVRAFAYIARLGAGGLADVTRLAALNANYVRARLQGTYHLPYDTPSLHECVFSDRHVQDFGVSTLDVAKRLLDYGFYAPTIYFPLVVKGALMIEPTETETKETLDAFVDALLAIAEEARTDPALLRNAPHRTRLARLDETRAARRPVLRWQAR